MKRMCFALAPLILAIAAAAYLLLVPIYQGYSGGTVMHTTLIQVNGPWAVVPVLFPVVLAAMPLVFRNPSTRLLVRCVGRCTTALGEEDLA